MFPLIAYGTIFENQDTKELFLDLGTVRYHVDGSRAAAKELQDQMHPESRRRVMPVKIVKLRIEKEKSSESKN